LGPNTSFNPAKLGNPELIRERKERAMHKPAALLGVFMLNLPNHILSPESNLA
jgi:hypothetical protein